MWATIAKWLVKGAMWAVANPDQLDMIIKTAKRIKGKKAQAASADDAQSVPTAGPLPASDSADDPGT